MKKYICKETFEVDTYDEDGFWSEGTTAIHFGAMFQRAEINPQIISGKNCVHLDGITVDEGIWLEITEEHLKEFFDEVKDLHEELHNE